MSMMPTRFSARTAAAMALFTLTLFSVAQPQKPKVPIDVGPLSMKTNLGSFKLVSHSDEDPLRGHLEMSFTGTVLVSGLDAKGKVTPSGGVRLEYADDAHKKRVYFGTGKLVVDGTARSIQWFGRGMQGTFVGRGLLRLYGEFDKDSKTGDYWFGPMSDTKSARIAWNSLGMQVDIPFHESGPSQQTIPTPRKSGG